MYYFPCNNKKVNFLFFDRKKCIKSFLLSQNEYKNLILD